MEYNNFFIYDNEGKIINNLNFVDNDHLFNYLNNDIKNDIRIINLNKKYKNKKILKINKCFNDKIGELKIILNNKKENIIYNKDLIKNLPLYVFGNFGSPTGYGNVTDGFCKNIKKAYDNTSLFHLKQKNIIMDDNHVSLDFHHPYAIIKKSIYKIIYTMIEGYTVPDFYTKSLDGCYDKFIVPTNFVKDVFSKYINDNRIVVIPPGVNEVFNPNIEKEQKTYFKLVDKDNRFIELTHIKPQGFKFVFSGRLCYRKGYDLVLKAYLEEFTNKDDVSLIIFSLPEHAGMYTKEFHEKILSICKDENNPNSPKIFLFDDVMDYHYSVSLPFSWADCFVYPSRGEGLGLPPLEAASCKIPLICSDNSGMGDYINNERALVINTDKIEPIGSKYFDGKYSGNHPGWKDDVFLPFMENTEYAILESPQIIEQLRAHMRYIYEHRNSDKINKMVENMYNIIEEKYNWEKNRNIFHNFILETMT